MEVLRACDFRWPSPIHLAGTRLEAVEPGDLLHGDENGVLHVPNDRAEDVLEKARLVRKIESELFDYVERDSVSVEDLKRRLGL